MGKLSILYKIPKKFFILFMRNNNVIFVLFLVNQRYHAKSGRLAIVHGCGRETFADCFIDIVFTNFRYIGIIFLNSFI